jgi:hypothetical protein
MILQKAGASVPGSYNIQIFVLDFINVQHLIRQLYPKLTEEPQAL